MTDAQGMNPADNFESASNQIGAIFQGGGAKGVAFSGALKAIEVADLEVRWVAGASAGAITAALVAAGAPADFVRLNLPDALDLLAKQHETPGRKLTSRLRFTVRASRRLRSDGSYFSTSELEEWLVDAIEQGLAQRESTTASEPKEARPRRRTFEQLWSETGVELHVVAANITTGSQIVFNHRQTPKCDVVRAVLASSAIPGAFPAWYLTTARDSTENESKERLTRRLANYEVPRDTLVDGGVWANYPAFVFRDPSFRQWAGFEAHGAPKRVIGFVIETEALDERGAAAARDRDECAHKPGPVTLESLPLANADVISLTRALALASPRREVTPYGEVEPESRMEIAAVLGVLAALIALSVVATTAERSLLGAVATLGWTALIVWFLATRGGRLGTAGHWPNDAPGWSLQGSTGRAIDEVLSLVHGKARFMLLVVPLLLGVATALFAGRVWSELSWVTLVVVPIVSGALLLFPLLVSTAMMWALSPLVPALSAAGHGLPATLLSASTSAPEWSGVHKDDPVVKVPCPDFVNTLTFDLSYTSDACRTRHQAAVARALALEPDRVSSDRLVELVHRLSYRRCSEQLEELGYPRQAAGDD